MKCRRREMIPAKCRLPTSPLCTRLPISWATFAPQLHHKRGPGGVTKGHHWSGRKSRRPARLYISPGRLVGWHRSDNAEVGGSIPPSPTQSPGRGGAGPRLRTGSSGEEPDQGGLPEAHRHLDDQWPSSPDGATAVRHAAGHDAVRRRLRAGPSGGMSMCSRVSR